MKRKSLHTLGVFLAALLLCITGKTVSAQSVINVQDSIYTNTHWTACNQYMIYGYVYVTAGTTLTIDPGTIIKGDKNSKGTLIVERGATIIANGTAAQPIVFTSAQAMGTRTYGDWGGVIICGKSPCNWLSGQGQVEGGPRSLYGGNLPHDNSGIFRYVRIEFGGVAFSPNNEVNGLTLCSVGDATQIDHIQVSYSGDDSYEWFGGTVNCKYLVSYRCWDDDFDTDCGYRGNVQFGYSLRDPFAADQSGSHCFESDSYQSGTKTGLSGDTSGLTRPVFANITCIGPMVSPTSTAFDNQYVSCAHIRRGSSISFINCIMAGYPCGILFDQSSASYGSTTRNFEILGAAGDSVGQIRGTIVCGIPTNQTPTRKELEYVIDAPRSLTPTGTEADTTTGTPFSPWSGPFNLFYNNPLTGPKTFNRTYATQATGVQLHNPYNLNQPDPTPNSTSPLVYNTTNLPSYVTAHYVACCSQTDHFGNGNKYPFNPQLPLSFDTTNFFANYNAPSAPPVWNSSKTASSWFTRTNFIGGFAGTQTTSDNWMNGWCNFDPQNTDYSLTSAPAASITAQGATQICPNGGAVVLVANSGAGFTYQWMYNNGNISGATSQNYTATQAGTYNVVVTNATGCSTTSAAVTVTNYAAPTATITSGGPVTFCQGGNVTLTGNGGVSYSWSNGANTPSITANTSGNYLVTVTDVNGCQATSSPVTVTVNALPTANITANGPTSFCTGDSVVLSANNANSYLWSTGATTQTITAYNSGNYTVQIVDANGCQSPSSTAITVSSSASPAPTVTVNGNNSLCMGDSVMLTSSTGDTYLWSNGATTQSIYVSASGTYSVTVTNSNACLGTGASQGTSVTVHPLPTAGFTSTGTLPTINFTNTSTGATTYTWDFGDFSSSSLANPSHTYGTNGMYTVCVTATTSFGCSDQFCSPVNVDVAVPQINATSDNFVLFPNPASNELNIAAQVGQDKEVAVVAFDVNGRVLINENQTLTAGTSVINYDVTNWDNGIYFVRITDGNTVNTVKVIINR